MDSTLPYSFEFKDFDAGARLGIFKLGDKQLETPNLFPVVSPFQNIISPRALFDNFGAQAIFTNAYLIYKSTDKKEEILEKGLQRYLDFPGLIATDSGGFQDYMYERDLKILPEEIEPFQEQIGSDCPVILDIPVQTSDTYAAAKEKVEITLQRAHQNLSRRTRENCAWFGPIHGSIYSDLLHHSAEVMSALEFGFYAIGGVVKTMIDYRFDLDIKILMEVRKKIRPDRPLHMFGLGLPSFFALAAACGADTFDSAAYILYAKDDRYFTFSGTKKLQDLDELPCYCPVCTKLTAREFTQLNKHDRMKALAEHNLYLSFAELRTVRQAIREGTLWELVENRIQAHPKLIKAMQITQLYPDYFISHLNFNKIKGQKIANEFAFYRPHFQYFRNQSSLFTIPQYKQNIVCFPELDLPSKSNPSLESWINQLRPCSGWNSIQILIICNLLGIIPYELAEMYPAIQHEGDMVISDNISQQQILFDQIHKFFINNAPQLRNIFIYLPYNYTNEYNEQANFSPPQHLISHLKRILETHFPQIHVQEVTSLEVLLNALNR